MPTSVTTRSKEPFIVTFVHRETFTMYPINHQKCQGNFSNECAPSTGKTSFNSLEYIMNKPSKTKCYGGTLL